MILQYLFLKVHFQDSQEKRNNKELLKQINHDRIDIDDKRDELEDEILACASPYAHKYEISTDYIRKLKELYPDLLVDDFFISTLSERNIDVEDDVLQEEIQVDDEIAVEAAKIDEPDSDISKSDAGEENIGAEELAITQPVEVEPEPAPAYATVAMPATEIAQAYIGDDKQPHHDPVHQVNLLWSMIDRSDTLIAYWFLKSLESAYPSDDPALPSSSLFETAAIAPYVMDIHGAAASLHTQSIKSINTDHHLRVLENSTNCAVQCVSVAATLQPCMFNPFPVTAQLLRTSAGVFDDSDFSNILIEIADIADRGQSFTLDDFSKSQVTHDIDASVKTIQQEIEDLRKHVFGKKTGYYWTNVITKDVIFESELEPIITIISKKQI